MLRLPKWVLMVLAVALVLGLYGRSWAADAKDATDTTRGTIKSVNDADRTFVMTDKNGKDWTFHLDPTAKVRLAVMTEGKLADLKKGDEVEIKYLKKGDDLIAEEVDASELFACIHDTPARHGPGRAPLQGAGNSTNRLN